ncbi:MAG: ATP-binding protein [Chloroflexi bacterium]|nr:ATP-binding protein [Chloroflexota bacterium]
MPDQPFHNRTLELEALQAAWDENRPSFLAVVGRRRVGKSLLLQHFFEGRAYIHLVGTAQTARNQLADASREVYRATADPVLEYQDFSSWDALLAYVGSCARDARLGFVLDEFSYYCDQVPELPSLLQRWWDRAGRTSRVFLVIADSHATFMEKLSRGDQPLFGRRTGELRLQPFDYADAARFFPTYAPEDRLRAYGVFGGMPAYLAACNTDASLADNILRSVLRSQAALRREPDYLLSQERSVKEPPRYLSVLRAIAHGATQPNEIALAAGFRSPADITGILAKLQESRLVARIVPARGDPGRRISRYVVSDPFLAFWFKFVQPAETLLERGFAARVLDEILRSPLENLDRFISRPQGPWEQACADYLWRALRVGHLGELCFDELGPWWEGRGSTESAEIDLVGVRRKRVTLVGSCNWRHEYVKLGDLHDLRATATRVGADAEAHYVLFARSGFDPNLVAVARAEGVILVTPQDMFDPDILDI